MLILYWNRESDQQRSELFGRLGEAGGVGGRFAASLNFIASRRFIHRSLTRLLLLLPGVDGLIEDRLAGRLGNALGKEHLALALAVKALDSLVFVAVALVQ